MPKTVSLGNANVLPLDRVQMTGRAMMRESQPGAASAEEGLASLLGGWEGSDELVSLIEESSRSSRFSFPLD